MTFALPRTLTLPSGRRVTVRDGRPAPAAAADEGLFADVLALDDALEDDALADLSLADFHVVRAVLMKAGRITEQEETVTCQNCAAELRVRPCANLETGPWEHGEADDPELDRTGPFGVPLVFGLVLRPRTVREARPLFRALGRLSASGAPSPLRMTTGIVEALGIERIGERRTPARIARYLATCDDATFGAIANAWIDAHYPLRLGADVVCATCGARNTIDAPGERELDRGAPPSQDRALPDLEAFVERAHAIAEPLLAGHPGVVLVVEDGTPAVDEGGEPLLGSYLPPPSADAAVPQRAPTVTIYWRTFLAVAREEEDFDWEDELRETLEHELEHHRYFLQGHDPMDEDERRTIADEAVRVVGKTEATRRALGSFGGSLVDFLRRAWPLVLLAALVLAITIAESQCAD